MFLTLKSAKSWIKSEKSKLGKMVKNALSPKSVGGWHGKRYRTGLRKFSRWAPGGWHGKSAT